MLNFKVHLCHDQVVRYSKLIDRILNENITVSYTNHIFPCHIDNDINGGDWHEKLQFNILVDE